jgi:DNA-binding MarR family transcriptional regulator
MSGHTSLQSRQLIPVKIVAKSSSSPEPHPTESERFVESIFSPNERISHLMREADKRSIRALQDRLAENNVAHGHWTFLRILWESDGISQARLSELAGVMTSSTSVAVQAMEKLGYIKRRQHKDNARKIYVYLTPAGRALEKKLVPLAIEVNNIATVGIHKKDREKLRTLLQRVIRNFDEAQKF